MNYIQRIYDLLTEEVSARASAGSPGKKKPLPKNIGKQTGDKAMLTAGMRKHAKTRGGAKQVGGNPTSSSPAKRRGQLGREGSLPYVEKGPASGSSAERAGTGGSFLDKGKRAASRFRR